MLSLAEAWTWVQIGFCGALGSALILGPIIAARGGGTTVVSEGEEPHCSRCCPNDDPEDNVP